MKEIVGSYMIDRGMYKWIRDLDRQEKEIIGTGVQFVNIKKVENVICSFDDLINPWTL